LLTLGILWDKFIYLVKKGNRMLKEIKDFVRDHYESFGAYPMEVETSDSVLTWDQYWSILDESGEEV